MDLISFVYSFLSSRKTWSTHLHYYSSCLGECGILICQAVHNQTKSFNVLNLFIDLVDLYFSTHRFGKTVKKCHVTEGSNHKQIDHFTEINDAIVHHCDVTTCSYLELVMGDRHKFLW